MGVSLLLDTHALLWALLEPAKLSVTARAHIQDSRNKLVVSSVSAWEIATKHRLGKLAGAEAVLAAYSRHLKRLGARELAISSEHALLAGQHDAQHRDPFDRMLAAQAMIEDLPLITRDPAFAEFPVRVLW